jgi:hypothetical protein
MHEKEQVFRDASYHVDAPDGRIHFRVGVPCPALDALLAELGVTEAAFITACNPGAMLRDADANRRAQQALEEALIEQGHRLLPGAGGAPDSGDSRTESSAESGGGESGTGIDSEGGIASGASGTAMDRKAESMPVPDSPDSSPPESVAVPDSPPPDSPPDSTLDSWQPEASCLVAGLSVAAAREIASASGQVAWVHIMPGRAPQLLFTGPAQERP